jgi:hypothetical protein
MTGAHVSLRRIRVGLAPAHAQQIVLAHQPVHSLRIHPPALGKVNNARAQVIQTKGILDELLMISLPPQFRREAWSHNKATPARCAGSRRARPCPHPIPLLSAPGCRQS